MVPDFIPYTGLDAQQLPPAYAVVAVPLLGGQLIGARRDRLAIYLCNPNPSVVQVRTDQTPAAGEGFPIPANGYLRFTQKDDGVLAQRAWFCLPTVALSISVAEIRAINYPN